MPASIVEGLRRAFDFRAPGKIIANLGQGLGRGAKGAQCLPVFNHQADLEGDELHLRNCDLRAAGRQPFADGDLAVLLASQVSSPHATIPRSTRRPTAQRSRRDSNPRAGPLRALSSELREQKGLIHTHEADLRRAVIVAGIAPSLTIGMEGTCVFHACETLGDIVAGQHLFTIPLMPKPTFAEILKQARNDAKLTQEVLANRTGLSRVYIALLETGKRSEPSIQVVEALGKALGEHFKEPTRRRYLPRDKKNRR